MAEPIGVIYEDNHVIVVNKPVNIPTQADESGDPDLFSLVKAYLKEKYQKPGNVFLGLVHRLDRPVGGLMVFAKTSKAAGRLSAQVREHSFQKTYLAVVRGIPAQPRRELIDYLKKDTARNQVAVVPQGTGSAKEAMLTYEVLESHRDLSLVRVALKTGRSHQIRVQLAHIGHPLYGDQKYGALVNRPGQQLALWSWGLSFIHPVREVRLDFHSQPPSGEPWSKFKTDGLSGTSL
jgi:23S rRNA pseudouridine1911/1915/1917 synthase